MSKDLQWVYGFHAVEAMLNRHPGRVQTLWLQDNREDQRLRSLAAQAQQLKLDTQSVDKAELQRTVGERHQGVAALCQPSQVRSEQELGHLLDALSGERPALLLILDGVTDPHNLGACLRSAEAAGADAVIIPKDRSAGLSATVRKVACGAAELIPVFRVVNLARCLRQIKQAGIWVSGLAGDAGASLYSIDLSGPSAIVLGAEGQGMRQLSRKECDFLAAIPMPGTTESLNVSVAAGICLFEACRQRSSAC